MSTVGTAASATWTSGSPGTLTATVTGANSVSITVAPLTTFPAATTDTVYFDQSTDGGTTWTALNVITSGAGYVSAVHSLTPNSNVPVIFDAPVIGATHVRASYASYTGGRTVYATIQPSRTHLTIPPTTALRDYVQFTKTTGVNQGEFLQTMSRAIFYNRLSTNYTAPGPVVSTGSSWTLSLGRRLRITTITYSVSSGGTSSLVSCAMRYNASGTVTAASSELWRMAFNITATNGASVSKSIVLPDGGVEIDGTALGQYGFTFHHAQVSSSSGQTLTLSGYEYPLNFGVWG